MSRRSPEQQPLEFIKACPSWLLLQEVPLPDLPARVQALHTSHTSLKISDSGSWYLERLRPGAGHGFRPWPAAEERLATELVGTVSLALQPASTPIVPQRC